MRSILAMMALCVFCVNGAFAQNTTKGTPTKPDQEPTQQTAPQPDAPKPDAQRRDANQSATENKDDDYITAVKRCEPLSGAAQQKCINDANKKFGRM